MTEFKDASRFTKDMLLPENALKPHLTETVKTEIACLEEELLESSKMSGGKRPLQSSNRFTKDILLPENALKRHAQFEMDEKIKSEPI